MPVSGPGAGGNYYAEFTTANPTTGAAQDADSLPVATATHNGTDDATFTLTVTHMDTGRYKVTGTVPGGYAAGDYVQVSVAATVATVAGKGVIDDFMVAPAAGTGGLPYVILADGVAHGGTPGSSTATISAQQVHVHHASDSAVKFYSGGTGRHGLDCRGGPSGSGIFGMGYGGARLIGATTGCAGLRLEGGGGAGPGVNTSGSALFIDGSSDFAHGVFLQAAGTAGDCVNIEQLGGGVGLRILNDDANSCIVLAPGAGHYGLDGTLSPQTLASLLLTATGHTYADAVAQSIVELIADNAKGRGVGL
jgi:hypothetical protein